MNGRLKRNWKSKCRSWIAGAIAALAWSANLASAQTGLGNPRPAMLPGLETAPGLEAAQPIPAVAEQPQANQNGSSAAAVLNALAEGPNKVGDIKQAGCCGQTQLGTGPGCRSCGSGGYGGPGQCVPGRYNCCNGWCHGDSCCGRIFGCLYDCICCPDPCYEPCWVAAANNAFWVDGARPVSQMRIRWDNGNNFQRPDRSEFFFAKIGGKGPKVLTNDVHYDDLSMYTETAVKGVLSAFVEIPYRELDPGVYNSGFSDMNVGTKSLLFDCELLQVTFQFRTYLPVGNSSKGLGTGHVSLEPSLLSALKLTPTTYLQAQLAEWIPIGGDSEFQGSILHYHFSLNQVLYRFMPDVVLIGSAEFNGYSFQAGQYSDLGAVSGTNADGTVKFIPQKAVDQCWLNGGPSVRLVICDKVDLGFSAVYSFSSPGPEQIYRTEFRWRF